MISFHQLFRVVSRVNGDIGSPLKTASNNFISRSSLLSRTPSPDRDSGRASITTTASASSCLAASNGRADSSGGSPADGAWDEGEASGFCVDGSGASGVSHIGSFDSNCTASEVALSPFENALEKSSVSPSPKSNSAAQANRVVSSVAFFKHSVDEQVHDEASSPLLAKPAPNAASADSALINDDEAVTLSSVSTPSPLLSATENSPPLSSSRQLLRQSTTEEVDPAVLHSYSFLHASPSSPGDDGVSEATRPLRRSRRRPREQTAKSAVSVEGRKSHAETASNSLSSGCTLDFASLTPDVSGDASLKEVWSVEGRKFPMYSPYSALPDSIVPLNSTTKSAYKERAASRGLRSNSGAFSTVPLGDGRLPACTSFSYGGSPSSAALETSHNALDMPCESMDSFLVSVALSQRRIRPAHAQEMEEERHPGVCFSPPKDVWRARITVEGRQFEQQFSVKRHGFKEAKMLAIRWREHMENYRSAKAIPSKMTPNGRVQNRPLS